jgi:Fe-S-cluster containining protein
MDHAVIESFLGDNARIYSTASAEDIDQLKKISMLYPDNVRLLRESDAVPAEGFVCKRCGACCSEVRFIPVSHGDVLRWVAQARWDVFDRLVVDRRRTPLMAVWGREAIVSAKEKARAIVADVELDDDRRRQVTEILYVTDLLECAVHVDRDWGHCAFFSGEDNACLINETKPRVCEKFPFYVGSYTDARLLKVSFCPGLKELAEKK